MATGETGFGDVEFDLISVQYHSLKAGHDYGQYVRDAENADLSDVAAFFRDVMDEDARRAKRCHELLEADGRRQRRLSGASPAGHERKIMTDFEAQDVVDVLTADHRDIEDLVEQVRACSGEERRDKTDTLIAELVRHSVAEEMHVYPAMKQHLADGDAAVAHDVEEHKGSRRS